MYQIYNYGDKLNHKIILIIISFILFIYGCYSYFYQRNKKWIKVNADIDKIEVIKKVEKDKKISYLVIYLKFNKGSISYYPVFTSNNIDELKEKLTDKVITIYYDVQNPNISYLSKPHQGLIRLLFSFILLIVSLLYYNQDKFLLQEKPIINDIETKMK